ncbi:MAG: sugar transferase, partial [Chitinophagales bacterium]|nr:sugar transferase [Chitinophagales bacterium]
MYLRLIKPFFDVLFAFIGIILCLPLFIVISLYCAINFNGQVFFTQQRIGKNEKVFI